jgi:hypothetical protein
MDPDPGGQKHMDPTDPDQQHGRIIDLGQPEKLTGLCCRLNLVQADSDATFKYDAGTDQH